MASPRAEASSFIAGGRPVHSPLGERKGREGPVIVRRAKDSWRPPGDPRLILKEVTQ